MTTKKKQHFVPRFYLKYFSNYQKNTHIGLYNFKSDTFIQQGDLRNQAYANFFYGIEGDIENALSDIERLTSEVIYKIASSQVLPKPYCTDYITIWAFTILQSSRTQASAHETEELEDKLMKNILRHRKEQTDDIDKLKFKMENPAAFNLKIAAQTMNVAFDLGCKLIVNETDIPFITSDHPVVKYNQFLERNKFPGGLTGLATKGLQIFFPITPKLILIFYDKKVYKCGPLHRSTISTSSKEDIHYLNLLQCLNCDKIVYFNNTLKQTDLDKLIERSNSAKQKIKDRLIINKYPVQDTLQEKNSVIFHSFREDHKIKLKLSFVKETDHAKSYKRTGYAVELRDESLRYKR
jgi:hypothetical protein